MGKADILLVEDDADFREALATSLALAGRRVRAVASAAEALRAVDADWPGVVLSDLRMPGLDGWALFRRIRAIDPDLPVILMTAHGDIPEAVAALKEGAWDFLAKPFAIERMLESVGRALAMRRLVIENRALKAGLAAPPAQALLGHSAVMAAVRARLGQLAATSLDLLVLGETGTGKSLAARLIHEASDRARQPFVAIDCGALPAALLDAELFGQVPGAYPGAVRRVGRIETAHRGTLFLDGIDKLSAEAQSRLIGVLDRREVRPLGSSHARTVDMRIIASAATDPALLVEAGRLRPELAWRLDGARLVLPPLRERREDIALLFAHFASRHARSSGREPPAMTAALVDTLVAHDWPGNCHELAQWAERATLGIGLPGVPAGPADTLAARLARVEASLLAAALADVRGDIAAACARLGLPRKTLYDKLKRHGLRPAQFRAG